MILPNSLKEFLNNRQNGITAPCESCNSYCCNGPGFAILENVLEIYNIYITGKLNRSDYEFKSDLTLSQFVFSYFDRVVLNNSLLVFFPKMLTQDKRLISVPPWNYWQARDYIKKREKSYGCIFLERLHDVENDTQSNNCILHSDTENEINQKPIDCVFLYCKTLKKIEKPSLVESDRWFSLLDSNFPNSKDRFYQLCPDLPD